jgi:coenzyme F420-reducing hydrogenase alpha subunit
MEDALGLRVTGPLRELRRLLYCGEWIESHVLHVFFLHAPDFLGYPDVIQMAKDHPELVASALRMKKAGNEVVRVLGGRAIHPINVRVGGFHRLPTRSELAGLRETLLAVRQEARAAVAWAGRLPFPEMEIDYQFVALREGTEYPFCEGRLVSNRGLDIAIQDYNGHFVETHVAHSNALHSELRGGGAYFTGPLARYHLNHDLLPESCREVAREAGLGPSCRNPFRSIIVRCVETLYAIEEALRIIEKYEPPERAYEDAVPRAGIGHGCTEAPRGILYHRYAIDAAGRILTAQIVPPTSQNQKTIEEDLRAFVELHPDLNDEQMTWQCEQVVRNYDPCISCATHFLRLHREEI